MIKQKLNYAVTRNCKYGASTFRTILNHIDDIQSSDMIKPLLFRMTCAMSECEAV
jgi:hypothetical protein